MGVSLIHWILYVQMKEMLKVQPKLSDAKSDAWITQNFPLLASRIHIADCLSKWGAILG